MSKTDNLCTQCLHPENFHGNPAGCHDDCSCGGFQRPKKDSGVKIKVVSFKESGKYYSEHTSELSVEHASMHGFNLADLIKNNDPSVREHSGLHGGFSGNFYYVVEVFYPDHVQNFCYFHMSRVRTE